MPFGERVGNSLFRYHHVNGRGPRFSGLYSKSLISENFVRHFCIVASLHDIGYRRIRLGNQLGPTGLCHGGLQRCSYQAVDEFGAFTFEPDFMHLKNYEIVGPGLRPQRPSKWRFKFPKRTVL